MLPVSHKPFTKQGLKEIRASSSSSRGARLCRTNPILGHLVYNVSVKSGVRWLLILATAGTLAASTIACPLWMSFANKGEMPCSDQSNSPAQCPFSICQANSPYLAAHVSVLHPPLVHGLPIELADSTVLWTSSAHAKPMRRDDEPPPAVSGPLFLRTHSFLI